MEAVEKVTQFSHYLAEILTCNLYLLRTLDLGETSSRFLKHWIKAVKKKGCDEGHEWTYSDKGLIAWVHLCTDSDLSIEHFSLSYSSLCAIDFTLLLYKVRCILKQTSRFAVLLRVMLALCKAWINHDGVRGQRLDSEALTLSN